MSRPRPFLPGLRPVLTLLALPVLIASACGGGGGGGGGGTPDPPTTPQPGITFSPSGAPAPAVRLARGAGSTGSDLELQVRADGLSGVYGAAFDLTFPGGLLDYQGVAEGSFLSGDDAGTSIQVAQTAAGRLVVGATRLGDVGGVDGSGVFVTLRFRATGAGSGSFGFTANRLLDSEGREISGISWAGGTVDVSL